MAFVALVVFVGPISPQRLSSSYTIVALVSLTDLPHFLSVLLTHGSSAFRLTDLLVFHNVHTHDDFDYRF